MDWYALRAAKAKGDLTEMALRVDRLMRLKPTEAAAAIDPEMQIDLVTSLKALHRGETARREPEHWEGFTRSAQELAFRPWAEICSENTRN